MKVALLAGLAAGIPLCFVAIFCVFYRLYCKRDRREDNIILGQGRKLWRKSYEVVGSSHESLSIPKHAPKVVSKFVQDSPQLSSTSTSAHISPIEDQLCLTEDDDDDDNSSLSNYRTAPDELYSPECPSVESRDTIELISLSPVKTSYTSENRSDPYVKDIPPLQEHRRIPSIRVVDENKDVLFKLDAKPNSSHREKRREDKIPLNLPSSVIQGNRHHPCSRPGMIDVSILYKQTTCELFLKVNKAIDLPVKDLRNNTSSAFVKLYVLPSRRYNYTTNIVSKCLNPVFNESFAIGGLTLMEILQLTIQFLVIHHEPIHRNIMIGELSLPLVNYEFVDEELTLCQNLREHKPKPVLGELLVSVCHQPLASKLSVTVVQARNLPKISNYGIGDPYVKVELFFNSKRLCKKKTRTKKKTTNPRFVQLFTFDLEASYIALESLILVMTILVKDPGGCHEKIGQVVLSSLTGGSAFAQWNEVIQNPHVPIEKWQMIHE
ncbi:synaptotagmin-7-like [Dendronephthya gigantea]|uniref:synaptotagmin-7-like n=1 Tax=Dendronephthya gigantea TaxID=151771 RepID=UPI00106AE589|nr:synaptotagmin-7-like [Dendronephthya gigantea]